MKLTIGHLYPDLLNLYGDRGNIQCFRKRLNWRGIEAEVIPVLSGDNIDFSKLDIVLLGGGSDREQELVCGYLKEIRKDFKEYVEDNGVVLAVCGGYQLLGETLDDSQGTESGHPQTLRGLGLLPTRTVFTAEKRRAQVTATAAAPFAGAALTGYEIHTGRTAVNGAPFCRYADGTPEGCVQNAVFGTYLHGLFDSGELTEKLTAFLCKKKGISPADAPLLSMEQYRQQQFDLLADGVRAALDMDAVYAAMGMDRKGGNRV